MEYEGLTDGSPVGVAGWWEEVEGEYEWEAEQDGHRREHRRDQEHHHARPRQPHQAGVPREVLEARPYKNKKIMVDILYWLIKRILNQKKRHKGILLVD